MGMRASKHGLGYLNLRIILTLPVIAVNRL
jgi:hypothetical protein